MDRCINRRSPRPISVQLHTAIGQRPTSTINLPLHYYLIHCYGRPAARNPANFIQITSPLTIHVKKSETHFCSERKSGKGSGLGGAGLWLAAPIGGLIASLCKVIYLFIFTAEPLSLTWPGGPGFLFLNEKY